MDIIDVINVSIIIIILSFAAGFAVGLFTGKKK